MSKIRIVNWLLTRRCNLKCDYCAIVKDYKGKPKEYPDMSHYIKNEMSTSYVIKALKLLRGHNPNAFHIFYGGEPLLRKDLPDIVNFCNENDIHYTIISNNTPEIHKLINQLIKKVDYIQGFTASIDPVLSSEKNNLDRITKSHEGFKSLLNMKKYVKDVVAEITVMKENVHLLYKLVSMLSQSGINSDITFIDIAKRPHYDFSNVTDPNLLVTKKEAEGQLHLLLNSDFDIHMKDKLIPEIFDSLPSNMDCEIEKGLHNISIDADGSLRLCLRVRGVNTPYIQAHQMFYEDASGKIKIKPFVNESIKEDKKLYCHLCNHTCQMMSKIIDKEDSGSEDLIHKDKRED